MPEAVRLSIEVGGVVQGVGFRPFVHELATSLGLSGFVRNRGGVVHIEIEGPGGALERFLTELTARSPPLARIERVTREAIPPVGEAGFSIETSLASGGDVIIAADVAACDACLAEMRDPADRRFGYPFINCTACGPRLTIVRSSPYDRVRTTMAGFPLCPECERELHDPRDRRFHAQPVACPRCGPRLRLLDAEGKEVPEVEPLLGAVARLKAGAIGAIKGLGGFHLVVDARNAEAVASLRARKAREAKPLAVMVADLAGAEWLCRLDDAERALLGTRERPIVVAARREGAEVAPAVAPGGAWLGVMLPDTPLQHLLLRAVGGGPLVMTSGNHSDEPIAYRDDEALAQLRGIADFFLMHDRPIQTRCDDSVARVVAGVPTLLRRSRGFAPLPLALLHPLAQPTLALGGHLKATFALGHGSQAVVSQHLGDLDLYRAEEAYRLALQHYQQLFHLEPRRVVHDRHPDYATTRLALELAAAGWERVEVQHHHAHFAGLLAEHAVEGQAIGVVFDGAGYGLDETIWGGELLVGTVARSERVGHLWPVGMPGGELAAREGWRMALAHLISAGLDLGPVECRVGATAVRIASRMLERRVNTPLTSSVGRLFDAVAFLAGGPERSAFEGHAAAWLEGEAGSAPAEADGYSLELVESGGVHILDPRPLIREVVDDASRGTSPAVIGRRFHVGLAAGVAQLCIRERQRSGVSTVALTGGVFVNALLAGQCVERLGALGFRVLAHRRLPPNDGGLSWGQLAVAAYRDAGG